MNTATIAVRTDPEVKEQAQKIFKGMGLDMSTAVNMFLKQTVNEKGFPFKPSLSPFERRVLEAASEPTRSFDSVDELMKELRNA